MSHAPRTTAARVRAPPLTHFIGLSLVTPASRPQLQASIDAFQEAARKDRDLLIPETVANHAIRPVDTLHLTICTLSLPEKEPKRLQEVISHLKELDLKRLWQDACHSKPQTHEVTHLSDVEPESSGGTESSQARRLSSSSDVPAANTGETQDHLTLDTPPLKVTLKGISTMRSAKSTTVVYAPPDDPTASLQRFCESIRESFRPYLPAIVPERNQEPETMESKVVPLTRPTLESFPHPDSYKSDISVPTTPAPASLSEPISPPEASVQPEPSISSSTEPHLSKRQQKRLAKKDLPFLLLHATLLNTIYVRKHNRKDRRPITIDARPLLERFKDMVWMRDVQIERLCLYRMGAKEVLDERGKGAGVVRYVAEAERELMF